MKVKMQENEECREEQVPAQFNVPISLWYSGKNAGFKRGQIIERQNFVHLFDTRPI